MTSNDLQRAATFIRNNLTVDDTPGELDHLRFADALKRHAVRKRRNRLVGTTVTIVLATIVGFAIPQSFKTEALTYRVGDSGQKGSVGRLRQCSQRSFSRYPFLGRQRRRTRPEFAWSRCPNDVIGRHRSARRWSRTRQHRTPT